MPFRRLNKVLNVNVCHLPDIDGPTGVVHSHKPVTLVFVHGQEATRLFCFNAASDTSGETHPGVVQAVRVDRRPVQR